jgi:hypothetical protein
MGYPNVVSTVALAAAGEEVAVARRVSDRPAVRPGR